MSDISMQYNGHTVIKYSNLQTSLRQQPHHHEYGIINNMQKGIASYYYNSFYKFLHSFPLARKIYFFL